MTSVSFTTGIPGGWWAAGNSASRYDPVLLACDGHFAETSLPLWWPSFSDKDGDPDDETLLIFTIFAGVMFGAGTASKILGDLADRLAGQLLTRLPRAALTKWGIYTVAKEIARWIGVKLTKKVLLAGLQSWYRSQVGLFRV